MSKRSTKQFAGKTWTREKGGTVWALIFGEDATHAYELRKRAGVWSVFDVSLSKNAEFAPTFAHTFKSARTAARAVARLLADEEKQWARLRIQAKKLRADMKRSKKRKGGRK